jgi:hypothetical protein
MAFAQIDERDQLTESNDESSEVVAERLWLLYRRGPASTVDRTDFVHGR